MTEKAEQAKKPSNKDKFVYKKLGLSGQEDSDQTYFESISEQQFNALEDKAGF